MNNDIESIITNLKAKIDAFQPEARISCRGTVLLAGDGIVYADGLGSVKSQSMVLFENGTRGVVFNLERDRVGIVMIDDYQGIKEGMTVCSMEQIVSIPVGPELLGRVIDPTGKPLDGLGNIKSKRLPKYLENPAPSIIDRQLIDTPLQTGILAIDAMFPIGRGQREAIIGDRSTGKTCLALDMIISQQNQWGKKVKCIYVAIGQRQNRVARFIWELKQHKAMDYTVVVVACASDPAGMQYYAPFAGCTIGEEFMRQGEHALIIYDDLTKHAWAYRQIALLLRRPAGREAYPGDIFYLHARLLERSAQYNSDHGGGSLTAIPIVETQLGDFTGYIPTNIISITDGQIFLDSNLFNAGVRPAINLGLSVSRVGNRAQKPIMKEVSKNLHRDMALYREMRILSSFCVSLESEAQAEYKRGQILQELFTQKPCAPLFFAQEIILLYAGTNGLTNMIQLADLQEWKNELLAYIGKNHSSLCDELIKKRQLSNALSAVLQSAILSFNCMWLHTKYSSWR